MVPDGVRTVRVLPGAAAGMPARGACEPQGSIKVGRRKKGNWEACERVKDIRCDAQLAHLDWWVS